MSTRRIRLDLTRSLASLVTLANLFFLCSSYAQAGQVTLAWDASTSSGVAGYEINYLQTSGSYASQVCGQSDQLHPDWPERWSDLLLRRQGLGSRSRSRVSGTAPDTNNENDANSGANVVIEVRLPPICYLSLRKALTTLWSTYQ